MRLAAILLPLTLLLRTPADAQCTATYTDGSVDDANTTFSAWTTVSDYYGQSSQCQMNWGLTFTHSYYASVGILSPSGRSATGTGYGQQTGGGGSASGFTSLAINGEEGTYYLEEDNRGCPLNRRK